MLSISAENPSLQNKRMSSKTQLFHHTFLLPSSPSPPYRISSRSITMSSCSSQPPFPTLRTVTVAYPELKDKSTDLSKKIEEGFGPNGLGFLSITDVPGFSSLRQNLLHLSPRLANLPKEVKKELEDPNSRYNYGWSHGKEKLESGKPDTLKGSFYANPIIDVPTTDEFLLKRYPYYCGSNIWPHDALPELEVAFKALGRLIFDVGVLVAYHCDPYACKGIKIKENEGLEQILLRSRCHKGRLLYYFPAQSEGMQDSDSMSSWCGWHTDHGSLTGLTCALFKRDGVEICCPDSGAGLYIKTRTGQTVKAVFGKDEIDIKLVKPLKYFQEDSFVQHLIVSGNGKLVLVLFARSYKAPKGEEATGLDRSTFALFMQPDWNEMLKFPNEMPIHKELMLANRSLTFGEYSEKLIDKYYDLKT